MSWDLCPVCYMEVDSSLAFFISFFFVSSASILPLGGDGGGVVL